MKINKQKLEKLCRPNNGIFTIDSKRDGPTITIMAGVHGDEKSGIIATMRLLDMLKNNKLKIIKGKVNLIFANLEAMSLGVRQTDANLNRVFRTENKLSKKELISYEYSRAKELMPILRSTDALLDLHSSKTPESPPFVICEPNSYFVATKMPVNIISKGWFVIEPGSTDAFVNKNTKSGNTSICIECGQHDDPKGSEYAFNAIMVFLTEFNSIAPQKKYPQNNLKQQYIWANYIYKNKINFRLANKFSDFQVLKKGTLIGYDGKQKIYTENDCVIIFARNRKNPNEEAFILATKN